MRVVLAVELRHLWHGYARASNTEMATDIHRSPLLRVSTRTESRDSDYKLEAILYTALDAFMVVSVHR